MFICNHSFWNDCLQCFDTVGWASGRAAGLYKWVMRCWVSGARCRLFAYGPADATAIPRPRHFLPHLNPYWFHLSGTCLPRLSWKRGLWMGVVVVVIVMLKRERTEKWTIKCEMEMRIEKLTVQRVNKSMQRPTKRHMFYDAHTFVVSVARTLECCVEIAVWVLLSAHELSRSQFQRCRT